MCCLLNNTRILALFVCLLSATFSFGQVPSYWGNLKPGKYAVGHQQIFTFDPSRTYDFTLGDSTVEMQNKPIGRPILMNVFFPVKNTNGGKKIIIGDLWHFSGEASSQYFLQKFESYEQEMAKMYAIDQNLSASKFAGDTAKYALIIEKLFSDYAKTELYAKDGLQALNKELPLIIYHQGLGGTFDENILLLEYLASNGFIVVSSANLNSDAAFSLGVGDTEASLGDIDFIIDYVKSNLSKSDKIYLTGHSFGANTAFTYPAVGKQKLKGIAPLDSDYGYAYDFVMRRKHKPNLKEQGNYIGLPIFAAGRSHAHFRMLDLMDKSNRYFLKIENVLHNDFCAQTIIGAAYCRPYSNKKEQIDWITNRYVDLCPMIATFFLENLKDQPKAIPFPKLDSTKMSLVHVQPGSRLPFNMQFDLGFDKCPSNSQLLDLIYNAGMEVAGQEWLNCKAFKDTSYFDYDWLQVYQTLINDSTTERALTFLDWFTQHRQSNLNLGGFAFYTYESALSDYGDGFHEYRANDVFNWMYTHFPEDINGHKGLIYCKRINEYNAPENEKAAKKRELQKFCEDFLKRFPNFLNEPTEGYWDETVLKIVKKNTTAE